MMIGNKNIIYIIFIILGFSFISHNSFSQNLSEEFVKDKATVKLHSSKSGESKKLANLYIKKIKFHQDYSKCIDICSLLTRSINLSFN